MLLEGKGLNKRFTEFQSPPTRNTQRPGPVFTFQVVMRLS